MAAISIIIPVYDTKEYLRECVESILASTYKDYEIILKDGRTIVRLIDDEDCFDTYFTFVEPDWHLRDWYY